MTKNKALKLFAKLVSGHQDVFVFDTNKTISECKNFNYVELLRYLESLDVPYEVADKFIEGEISFADMNGEVTYDDIDFLEIKRDKNNKLQLSAWTETRGNVYLLSDYNKKWKERCYNGESEMQKQLDNLFEDLFKCFRKSN